MYLLQLGLNKLLLFCGLITQFLEQLRTNRANLKPVQLQMLEQLEKQLSLMQQNQQVRVIYSGAKQTLRKSRDESEIMIEPSSLCFFILLRF